MAAALDPKLKDATIPSGHHPTLDYSSTLTFHTPYGPKTVHLLPVLRSTTTALYPRTPKTDRLPLEHDHSGRHYRP